MEADLELDAIIRDATSHEYPGPTKSQYRERLLAWRNKTQEAPEGASPNESIAHNTEIPVLPATPAERYKVWPDVPPASPPPLQQSLLNTEQEWRDWLEPFHVGNASYIHHDGRRRELISSLQDLIATEKERARDEEVAGMLKAYREATGIKSDLYTTYLSERLAALDKQEKFR